MKYILILISLTITIPSLAQNKNVHNFSKAKRALNKIYNKTSLKKETIYGGCKFSGKVVDLKSCGYTGILNTKGKNKGKEKFANRKNRVEWEHVFPISKAIRSFSECRLPNGKKLSRKKCEKASKGFELALSDMYNLWPSVGSMNAARSNYSFTESTGNLGEWGDFNFKVESRKVSIRDEAKGAVARTYMYMDSVYPFKAISNKNKRMFALWDKKYPVTKEECKRYKLIKQYQGNENPVLASRCK